MPRSTIEAGFNNDWMKTTANWYDQRAQHIIPHFPRSQELESEELLAVQREAAAAQTAENVRVNPAFLHQYGLQFLQQPVLPPVRPAFCHVCLAPRTLAASAATSCL
jgi:hypothetical protein